MVYEYIRSFVGIGKMKVKKTLLILFFISISQISYGDILIYKINNSCLEFNGVEGEWEKIVKRERGYLILDLNYLEDGTIDVNDAVQVMYWTDRADKLYRESYRYIDIIKIIHSRKLYWMFVEKNANVIEVQSEILKGDTKDISEDSDNLLGEIAQELKGDYLSDIQLGTGHYIDINSITLRLHMQWTLWANEIDGGDGDFDYAISDIVLKHLQRRGYDDS